MDARCNAFGLRMAHVRLHSKCSILATVAVKKRAADTTTAHSSQLLAHSSQLTAHTSQLAARSSKLKARCTALQLAELYRQHQLPALGLRCFLCISGPRCCRNGHTSRVNWEIKRNPASVSVRCEAPLANCGGLVLGCADADVLQEHSHFPAYVRDL